MTKIVSGLLTFALLASLAAGAQAKDHDNDRGKHRGEGMGHARRCPPGDHWVRAHRNRYGQWIQAHCTR